MEYMSDLRFAVRMFAKSPGFTLVAVVLLAVGVGANALIFSAFDAVLWRPLPVRHAEELVRMVQRIPRIGISSRFTTLSTRLCVSTRQLYLPYLAKRR
jgi:hypothetical protein